MNKIKNHQNILHGCFLSFLFFSLACLHSSCSDSGVSADFQASLQEMTLKSELKINKTNFEYSPQGGEQIANITATYASWALDNMPSWVQASALSGNSSQSITLSADANTEIGNARSSISQLVSTNESSNLTPTTLTFTQSAIQPYITVDVPSFTVSASATAQTVQVTSNVEWTYECSATWINITRQASSLQLSIYENLNSESDREAVVSLVDIATNKELANIKVLQRAYSEIKVPETMSFSAEGGVQTFTLTSEVSWTVVTSQDWIEVNPSSGNAGTTEVSISVTPNSEYEDRHGLVYVRVNGKNTAEITVNQRRRERIIVDSTAVAFTFPSTGGNLTLTFSANCNWNIKKTPESASWLSVSPTSGIGGDSINVLIHATDNASVVPRTCTLSIIPDQGNSFEVTYTQSGRYLNLSTDEITMFAKGGSNSISVSTDGIWSVTSSVSWLTVTKNTSSFIIKADKNITDSDRSGTVTVELTGLTDANRYTKTLTVKQLPQGELYFNDVTSGTPSAGTSFSIDLTGYGSDVDWDGQLSGDK